MTEQNTKTFNEQEFDQACEELKSETEEMLNAMEKALTIIEEEGIDALRSKLSDKELELVDEFISLVEGTKN